MATTIPSLAYREVSLPQGTIRYVDQGTGPTLVFIHGLLVNSTLWRKVIPRLSDRFRCIAPDIPLGSHAYPMNADADLTPLGVAHIVADFMAALQLTDITLIGNDTGGAICQLVLTQTSAVERITRLVLTNCDAFEAFFPPLISPFQYGPRFFGPGFVEFLAWLFRARTPQRLLLAAVARTPVDNATLDANLVPFLTNAGIRYDLNKFLPAVSNRYTLEAARRFSQFQHPVRIIWGKNDIFFSASNARRLQKAFPDATLEFVSGSRAFVPEDQPEILARRIAEFVYDTTHS